jgi:hypothetical protein
MVVLQSCTNSAKVVAALCDERRATSSGDLRTGVSTKVEEVADMDIEVLEISVVKVEEETTIDIKEKDIPLDGTFPAVKAEEDQVSSMCVCPLLDTFPEYPIMLSTVWYLQLSQCLSGHIKQSCCGERKYFCLCFWVM